MGLPNCIIEFFIILPLLCSAKVCQCTNGSCFSFHDHSSSMIGFKVFECLEQSMMSNVLDVYIKCGLHIITILWLLQIRITQWFPLTVCYPLTQLQTRNTSQLISKSTFKPYTNVTSIWLFLFIPNGSLSYFSKWFFTHCFSLDHQTTSHTP